VLARKTVILPGNHRWATRIIQLSDWQQATFTGIIPAHSSFRTPTTHTLVDAIMKRYAIFSLLLAFSAASHAYFDGKQLADNMHEYELMNQSAHSTNTARAMLYIGYVGGVFDTLSLAQKLCRPEDMTNGEAEAIVSKFLKENPGELKRSAGGLVAEALMRAYPCDAPAPTLSPSPAAKPAQK